MAIVNDTRSLRPGAEPFSYGNGSVGVMMIHGYTGSPDEVRSMGKFLSQAGYIADGILLAHHGGTPAELFNIGWEEWVASAERDFHHLQQRCPQVIVAGFSMGALVALHLAARYPVAGLILMAPALRLRHEQQLTLAAIGKYIMPWIYPLQRANFSDPKVRASIREFMPDANLDDPAIVAQIRQAVRLPTGSIYEVIKLKRAVVRHLRHITVPLLVMQGRLDQTVDPSSAEQVMAAVGSRDKQLVWFERSGHMLTRQGEPERVWQTAATWLQERFPVERDGRE